jgi:peptidoglycan/xylan/chitin deacetylase (PgdA/CDA1 family)
MVKNILVIFLLVALIISASPALAADKPKVIITFDDGWTSQYYKAFPIMQANHQLGTAFIITGIPETATGQVGMEYMNVSQLKVLYNAGWDLGSHTVDHPDLTTLSTSAMNAELSTSQQWLKDNGFPRGSQYLAYPYGAYNAAVISAVKANGYLAARTVDAAGSPYPKYTLTDPNRFNMATVLVGGVPGYGNPATPPSYILSEINNTIAANGLLIITFHIIEDDCCAAGAAPEEYKTADFKTISDFLKSKQDAGQLDVVTMSGYFETSGTPTPTPTPTPIPTPTPTPTPIPTPTPTPTPAPTPTPTPTPTPNMTIIDYYKSLGTNKSIVETTDLLKAADDWSNNRTVDGFTSPITTQQLLTLADEWSAS